MTELVIKKQRRQLTLNEKLCFLNRIDCGIKLTAAAREFGISNSTASGIVKERTKIKLLHEHYKLAPHRKRMRLSLYSDVDEAVHMWYRQMRSQNRPVNGPMLQQKARLYAQYLGHTNFEGSSGWLFRFRERHDMSVESMRGPRGECNNSYMEMVGIGMTDEEIVSSVTHNNVAQSEYIVSNVDEIDIRSYDFGTEMPVCSTYLEEEPVPEIGTSSNSSQYINFCDSTDEVEVKLLEEPAEPSSTIKYSEAVSIMKNLSCFLEKQTEVPKHIWDSMNNINKFILGDLKEQLKQKKITDFFK